MAAIDTEERVVVADLADDLQVRKQRIFKLLPRLGILATQRREPTRGNQLVSTVSIEDAKRIRASIASANGGDVLAGGDGSAVPVYADDAGFFYLIQLEPSADAGRYKVGFTTDLDGRLQKHRCSAPFAAYLTSWPCKRTWERAAIDCCIRASEQLHTEVFRTADLAAVRVALEAFFALMPPLTSEADADAGAS